MTVHGWKLTCPNGHELDIASEMEMNTGRCHCWSFTCDVCGHSIGYNCKEDRFWLASGGMTDARQSPTGENNPIL
jgi:hypothetical protein